MLTIIGRISWIIIKQLVTKMIEAGATPQAITRAVAQQLERFNYAGDALDLKIIWQNVERLLTESGLHAMIRSLF